MLELPSSFLSSISNCCGFDKDDFINAHQIDSPTSIRINPFKPAILNFDLE